MSDLLHDSATGLFYRLLRPSGEPTSCLVLLHGVGGDELNLAPLGTSAGGDTLVVLARGPLTIGPGQFAWFRVSFSAAGPAIDEVQAEDSRRIVASFIEQLQSTRGVAPGKTIVAGFSQGGIISASVALSTPERVGGFGILSGRILPELEPRIASTERLSHLRAFIGHGSQDKTLPVSWAHRSDTLLSKLGVPHETNLYPIGHAISGQMQDDFVAWVRDTVR